MKYKLNGVTLDTDNSSAKHATQYAKEKGLNVNVVLATFDTGKKEYWLLDDSDIEYTSTSLEAIGAHIDMMALAESF